ncbi:MAG: hypothetical protein LBC51_07070 [Treponema sp.]|jgi:uncharacterized phage-associated protein|nr:hypothetical protein [Treponema sp.]
MIDSVEFAKYLVWRAKELEELYHVQYELGPTKLNKIMYICEGILLAYGINIIKENAQAWDDGPIYPRVYKWISEHPDVPLAVSETPDTIKKHLENYHALPLIDRGIIAFAARSTEELTAWSQEKSSPWAWAMQKAHGAPHYPIDKYDMARYFSKFGK